MRVFMRGLGVMWVDEGSLQWTEDPWAERSRIMHKKNTWTQCERSLGRRHHHEQATYCSHDRVRSASIWYIYLPALFTTYITGIVFPPAPCFTSSALIGSIWRDAFWRQTAMP
ncbi:uncharacterized protein [Drosophila pseudoobscura]|uniref:Uncharacterized protein n=1 Tax=Drosophila pseudoobscura pseudoobscura TaxID=46245 RepID=A0A6I8VY32_DROPS|nr:uncharacterized protein LOC26532524 [Drosophila pseudoobscura]XP_033235977.1 uncharacterized protein LOC26532524 [Drosophila pseudoobscura]